MGGNHVITPRRIVATSTSAMKLTNTLPRRISVCASRVFFFRGLQTAAHHLEAMREARALGMGPGMTLRSGRWDTEPASPAQEGLLKEGVARLLRQAEGEAAAVTELLEELRYEGEGLV